MFKLLVEHQLTFMAMDETATAQGGALSYQQWYVKSRDQFLTNSDMSFRTQLTEFKDHSIVAMVDDAYYIPCQ